MKRLLASFVIVLITIIHQNYMKRLLVSFVIIIITIIHQNYMKRLLAGHVIILITIIHQNYMKRLLASHVIVPLVSAIPMPCHLYYFASTAIVSTSIWSILSVAYRPVWRVWINSSVFTNVNGKWLIHRGALQSKFLNNSTSLCAQVILRTIACSWGFQKVSNWLPTS